MDCFCPSRYVVPLPVIKGPKLQISLYGAAWQTVSARDGTLYPGQLPKYLNCKILYMMWRGTLFLSITIRCTYASYIGTYVEKILYLGRVVDNCCPWRYYVPVPVFICPWRYVVPVPVTKVPNLQNSSNGVAWLTVSVRDGTMYLCQLAKYLICKILYMVMRALPWRYLVPEPVNQVPNCKILHNGVA